MLKLFSHKTKWIRMCSIQLIRFPYLHSKVLHVRKRHFIIDPFEFFPPTAPRKGWFTKNKSYMVGIMTLGLSMGYIIPKGE